MRTQNTRNEKPRDKAGDTPSGKSKTAPEIVASELIQQIESNQLKPGQKLPPQSALSKKFNVGMSTIREAINVLEVMGYLNVIHGSGTYVNQDLPLSKTMLEKLEGDLLKASSYELFELRELLECHAVRQAARRADPPAIGRIKSAYEALRQSASDRQMFLECDRQFHLTISRSIDLEANAALIYLIFEITHKHFNLASTTLHTVYREKAILSAEQVVQHIEKGEEEMAARCMRRHLDSAKHAIAKVSPT